MKKGLVFLGIGLLVAFVLWYKIASNYDYEALAGVYTFSGNAEKCTLTLNADKTFSQELQNGSITRTAKGEWHRYGQSHVSFSRDFLTLRDQQLNESGEAHGEFEKTAGIFTNLVLAPLPNGPTFHKTGGPLLP